MAKVCMTSVFMAKLLTITSNTKLSDSLTNFSDIHNNHTDRQTVLHCTVPYCIAFNCFDFKPDLDASKWIK